MEIKDCSYLVKIESLSILWCTKYSQIVGSVMPQICMGCQNSEEIRDNLDETAKIFKTCEAQAKESGICPKYNIPTNELHCKLCKEDIETRASHAYDLKVENLTQAKYGVKLKTQNTIRSLETAMAKLEGMIPEDKKITAQPEMKILRDLITDYIESKRVTFKDE